MKFESNRDTEYQLNLILNGGIELNNLRGGAFEITSTGVKQTLTHNLGFVPNGYIVLLINGDAAVVAEDIESWTENELYLSVSVASLTVRLFVL